MKETFTSWQEIQEHAQGNLTQWEAIHAKQLYNIIVRVRAEIQALKDRVTQLENQ